MTATIPRPADSQPDPDPSPMLPVALRQGLSVGQGVAALVIAVGLGLLLLAEAGLRPLGVVLLVAGIVTLAAVETVRVVRRRRALRVIR